MDLVSADKYDVIKQECERLQALVDLAKEMRIKQRKYFFSKTRDDLVEAKQIERRFDEAAT